MDEYRRIAHAHLAYAKAVLLDPPAHRCRGVLYRSAGVASLLTITLLLLTLCLALHATLPSRSPSISFLRFLAFFAILFALWPLLYDREHYTLGSDFRDIAIPSCLWLPLSEATRVCIVSLWDEEYERAPRWIVPKSEAHKWKGAYPVDGEGADATANKGDRMTNGKPNGHASANGATNDKTSSRTTTRNDDTHRMPPLIPRDWYYVPHPAPFSLLRLLWATDSMSLRRPGTSLLFPSHQRALEWSLPVLQKASEIYDRAAAVDSPREADAIRRTSPVWFGLKEWGIIASAAQLSFLVAFCRYVKSLNLSIQHGTYSPDNFYDLPLHTQYLLTFGLGSLVVFPASSGELLAHALQRVGSLPTTAVIPSFQQPLLSSGPRDFWNRRWHQFLRRDFSILAKLVPGTREFPFIRFVATFAVSAAEHSECAHVYYKSCSSRLRSHTHSKTPSLPRPARLRLFALPAKTTNSQPLHLAVPAPSSADILPLTSTVHCH